MDPAAQALWPLSSPVAVTEGPEARGFGRPLLFASPIQLWLTSAALPWCPCALDRTGRRRATWLLPTARGLAGIGGPARVVHAFLPPRQPSWFCGGLSVGPRAIASPASSHRPGTCHAGLMARRGLLPPAVCGRGDLGLLYVSSVGFGLVSSCSVRFMWDSGKFWGHCCFPYYFSFLMFISSHLIFSW